MSRDLSDRVRLHFGLAARPNDGEVLERALQRLCAEHGLTPPQVGLRLQHDRELLRDVASAITVGETFFFRHRAHFEHLVARLGRHEAERPFYVLCAGCSNGAEPYSLVIAILEAGLGAQGVEIVACDVSRTALEQARAGSYSDWELRETPIHIRDRYFRPAPGGRWQLVPEVRQRVTFAHRSIQEQVGATAPRSVDAILCRNVTVYLDPAAQQPLYASMAGILAAEGRLLIAPTDPIPTGPSLVRIDDPNPTLFGPASADHRSSATPSAPEPQRNELNSTFSLRGVPLDTDLDSIRTLADAGRHLQALQRLDPICAARPDEARLHLLRGQLCLAAERWEDAVEAMTRSVSADPDDPLARYWLVLALRDAGEQEQALAEAHALRRALDDASIAIRGRDAEITPHELRQAVRHLEEELR